MSDNPIREALELLRHDGWTRNAIERSSSSSRCLADAVLAAQPHLSAVDLYSNPTVLTVDAVAREQFPDRYLRWGEECPNTVWPFNDHHDTTFADVEAVMEKAALLLDERISA